MADNSLEPISSFSSPSSLVREQRKEGGEEEEGRAENGVAAGYDRYIRFRPTLPYTVTTVYDARSYQPLDALSLSLSARISFRFDGR